MRTFVMGDIHGAFRALQQCLERSGFDKANDVLIQLGDVTDGYPQVYECVEVLLEIKHLVAIKGNHDDWFNTFIITDFHPYHWNYGGKGTLNSYLDHAGKSGRFFAVRSGYKTALGSEDVPVAHRNFFEGQLAYHINEQHQFFVHAGFNRHLSLHKQKQEDFYWDRNLWLEALHWHTYKKDSVETIKFFSGTDFKEIYIGHTPTLKWGTDKPMRALNILNVDTGAGHSGRLTILDVNTKNYWQSDPLPELYSENYRQELAF